MLALRTGAVALATFSTFLVGVFISSHLAIHIQEKLGILKPIHKPEEAKPGDTTTSEPITVS